MNDLTKAPAVAAPTPASHPQPAASAPAPASSAPAVRSVAGPAKRGRHRKLFISFFAVVILPVLLIGGYLGLIAKDRYVSTIGFAVRSANSDSSASMLLGGIASLAGGSVSGDSDILNQYIRSQQMVEAVDRKLDLKRLFSDNWVSDPVFKLRPGASIEQLTSYWSRIVNISYDQSTGLMQVEANAFSPQDAKNIAQEILSQGQMLINSINDTAHRDGIRYAQEELSMAEERLKKARASVAEFRTQTKIVDLQADLQSKLAVISNLQQQLTQEQVGLKDLLDSTKAGDPRVSQAQRRIDALEQRISVERDALSKAGQVKAANADLGYPEAISRYEALQTDQEFAQKTYVAALSALDAARLDALRQSRYLATYIQPTIGEEAKYPQRAEITSVAFLFLVLFWGIGALVVYSIREHA